MTPLFHYLMECLKTIKEDCTFNQEKGAQRAAEWMAAGNTVHSVDLSNATDSFPLSVQLAWMRDRCLPIEQTDLFERISKGKFKVPSHLVSTGFPAMLTWSVGQPLGIRPSFAAFALTHHFTVRGLCLQLGILPDSSGCLPYEILGDDLLIFDEKLYQAYICLMSSVDVKISVEKSFISADFAEFAGYSIFSSPTPRELLVKFSEPTGNDFSADVSISDGRTISIARAGKFRPFSMKGIRNLIGLLGAKATHEAPSKERLFVEVLCRLPSPYGGAGKDNPEDGYGPLLTQLKELMDDPSFFTESVRFERELGSHIAEAWSKVIGVRSYNQRFGDYAPLHSLGYQYEGDIEAQSKLRVLVNAVLPGRARALRGYLEIYDPKIIGDEIVHVLNRGIERDLITLCVFFEVPRDTPYYRLRKLLENLITEACPATVRPVSDTDDVQTIRRALKLLNSKRGLVPSK
jgi:hypothetical protein